MKNRGMNCSKNADFRVCMYGTNFEYAVDIEELYMLADSGYEAVYERSKHKYLNHLITFNKFAAFTLAEVLITLGIIGIVAAITMPMLIANINERVNSERHANIAHKMTQAMEQMRAHGKLVQYASTDAFVDELQNYLKITKRCDAAHIAECWPTSTVLDSTGEEYYIKDCKRRKNLLLSSSTNGDNVGLVLADGASIILTYDPNTNPIDIGDKVSVDNNYPLPIGNGKTKDFAYTTSVTQAIDFITDVNGKKGPNAETKDGKYYDIRKFKFAKLSNGCAGIKIPDIGCVVNLESTYEHYGTYKHEAAPSWTVPNYRAGAEKACLDIGMNLPSMGELSRIYNSHAAGLPTSGNFWSSTGTRAFNFSNPELSGDRYKAEHYGALCFSEL